MGIIAVYSHRTENANSTRLGPWTNFFCSSGDESKAVLNGRLEVEIYFIARIEGTVLLCLDGGEMDKASSPLGRSSDEIAPHPFSTLKNLTVPDVMVQSCAVPSPGASSNGHPSGSKSPPGHSKTASLRKRNPYCTTREPC